MYVLINVGRLALLSLKHVLVIIVNNLCSFECNTLEHKYVKSRGFGNEMTCEKSTFKSPCLAYLED